MLRGKKVKMNNITVDFIVDKLGLSVLCGREYLHRNVSSGYCCDLLSWVMAHAEKGSAWITVQTHVNIVAIATLLDISCIIVPEGIDVNSKVIEKAEEEGVVMLSSYKTGFELAGELYAIGVGSKQEG
jgi:predicted transcriptional regulator